MGCPTPPSGGCSEPLLEGCPSHSGSSRGTGPWAEVQTACERWASHHPPAWWRSLRSEGGMQMWMEEHAVCRCPSGPHMWQRCLLLAGALPHYHDHGVSHHQSRGSRSTCQHRVLGGPAAECSSPHLRQRSLTRPLSLTSASASAHAAVRAHNSHLALCPQTRASSPSWQPLLHPSQETGCRARGQCTACHCATAPGSRVAGLAPGPFRAGEL